MVFETVQVRFLLAGIALANVIEYGGLQPIQPAKPIFETSSASAIPVLDEIASNAPDGVIALNGFEGAVLNGLGYKSAGHAFLVPMPEWYRPYFPELTPEEYNVCLTGPQA